MLLRAEEDWAQLFLGLLDSKRATKMRQQFASLLIRYHDTPDWRSEVFTQGRRGDFATFLKGFLDEHGTGFSCERQRSHLIMADPTVGLLHHKGRTNEESSQVLHEQD